MHRFFEATIAIRDFLELGGPVLIVITIAILMMWILIVERILYFRTDHKRRWRTTVDAWEARAERRSKAISPTSTPPR